MKNIFTIFSLTIFLSINAQTFKISEYDLPKIVSELFDATYNRQTKEFIWKPNYADNLSEFEVSTDGNLYTKIDTLLTHNKAKNIVTIATSTYVKDQNGEKESCHACSPMLSLMSFKIDDARENLQLLYFKKYVGKHGTWGEPAWVEILQFSENDYFVKVSEFQTGQGSGYGSEVLYYNGNEVLRFDSLNAGGDVSWETSMKVDKINRIITLTKKGTDISKKTGKVIPVNKITKYKINDDPVSIVKI